jgi:hypothetical protein
MPAITKRSLIDTDLIDGLKQGALLGCAILVLVLPPAPPPWRVLAPEPESDLDPIAAFWRPGDTASIPRRLNFAGAAATASADVKRLAQWIVDSRDNGNLHFALIDKKNTRVFVFDPSGRLIATTPVLLGYAPGDDTVAGIGSRPLEEVKPAERTTPAGRFVSQPGRNARQEEVIWVDYDGAVSMHRVLLNHPNERRLERLASPTIDDNRISYGCINLPVAFFDHVVWPVFSRERGIVYVLPEIKPLADVFPEVANTPAS